MKTPKCFVIMSFKPDFDLVYRSAIKPAVDALGLESVRVDDTTSPGNIPSRIVREIIDSQLIIADLTEPNPNVYYELGIGHAIGNKTIVISQDPENLPFDVQGEFTLRYSNDREGLRLLGYDLQDLGRKLLDGGIGPTNLVQSAGRDFFDLTGSIRQTLDLLGEELNRTKAFSRLVSTDGLTDNTSVVAELAAEVVSLIPGRSGMFLVAVNGAAGLGKTTTAKLLAERIRDSDSSISAAWLPLDSFMFERAERYSRNLSGYDPLAHNVDAIRALSKGVPVSYRAYDHLTGKHRTEETTVMPARVLILDGIHSFHPAILPRVNRRIFLYASPPVAKELRFLLDVKERGYTPHQAFSHAEEEYENFERYILHYAKFADRIVQCIFRARPLREFG